MCVCHDTAWHVFLFCFWVTRGADWYHPALLVQCFMADGDTWWNHRSAHIATVCHISGSVEYFRVFRGFLGLLPVDDACTLVLHLMSRQLQCLMWHLMPEACAVLSADLSAKKCCVAPCGCQGAGLYLLVYTYRWVKAHVPLQPVAFACWC